RDRRRPLLVTDEDRDGGLWLLLWIWLAQWPARHSWRIAPIPEIRLTTTSPGDRYRGGLRAMPTPAGVPVKITSPGSSGQMPDNTDTRSGTGHPIADVRPFCTVPPLICRPSSTSSDLSSSSGVTSHGP